MVVDGSWVDLITRVDGTFFLERQGFASFLHKTIPTIFAINNTDSRWNRHCVHMIFIQTAKPLTAVRERTKLPLSTITLSDLQSKLSRPIPGIATPLTSVIVPVLNHVWANKKLSDQIPSHYSWALYSRPPLRIRCCRRRGMSAPEHEKKINSRSHSHHDGPPNHPGPAFLINQIQFKCGLHLNWFECCKPHLNWIEFELDNWQICQDLH